MSTSVYTKYKIRNNNDVIKLQNKLKDNFEIQHVAQEFAKNMVEDNEEGHLLVNGVEVISVISKNKLNENTSKKVYEAIVKAKENFDKKDTSSISTKNFKEKRGRGLLSVLCLGWQIFLENTPKSLIIKAIKS